MSTKHKTLELVYLTEPDRDKWIAAEWDSSNEFAEPTNIYMVNSVASALRAALNQERAEKAAVEGISAVLGDKVNVDLNAIRAAANVAINAAISAVAHPEPWY